MGLVYHSPGLVLFLTPASAVGKPGLPAVLPGLLQALPSLASLQIGQAPQAQQQQQGERQQRREAAQRQAQAAVAQAESALVASEAQMSRLAQQEQRLVQEVLALLNETGAADPARLAATLPLDGTGPCATSVGQVCQVGGTLAGSTGTVVNSMAWRIVVPAGLIRPGDAAVVFIPTTQGTEFFRCPPAVTGQPTICAGTTVGNGRQGGTVRVLVGDQLVAQGTINGPGVMAAPPPATPVPLAPIRIELTWGASPRDLDAHLWVPLPPPAPGPPPGH